MNPELHALIDLVFGLGVAGISLAEKKDFTTVVLPQLEDAGKAIPAVISNWSDLKAEIDGLSGTQSETDLAAYVVSKFGGSTDRAQKIVAASLNFAMSSYGLYSAIKG